MSRKKRKKHSKSSGQHKHSSGMLSGMRSTFKKAAGTSGSKNKKKKGLSTWDIVFWLTTAVIIGFAIYRFAL